MPLWKPPKYPVVSEASPLTTTTGNNNGLSPGITYASPLFPFYGSGTTPTPIPSVLNVSTLNAQDSITVGGTGQTLTGAGGELLINGKPLATVSTVSSLITLNNSTISTLITDTTAKWATYPAVSTLQMNGNKMLDVSSISGVAGQTLPIIASNVYFGTNGQLTGVSTINGLAPGIGNVADWANYSAVQDLNLNSKNLNSANQLNLNTGGNAVMLTAGAGNNLLVNGNPIPTPTPPTTPSTITGQNTYMTATGGTLASANSIITAGGGTGGNITATANSGDLGVSGGNISLTANGGTGLGGLYGVVNLTANPGTDLVSGIATGGSVNILANSPTLGLTSKVSITGGGVNIYSGIFTPLTSVFGYTFINASLGISLVSGGFSPFPQSPGTTYIYGAQGIILDNGVYATDIQPIWDGNPLVAPPPLTIHGRTAGGSNVPVILQNVNNIQMQGDGNITGVNNINGAPYPPTAGSIPPNLTVSTITFNPTGYISSLNQINNGIFLNDTGTKITFAPDLTSANVGQIDGLLNINTGLGVSPLGDTLTFAPGLDRLDVGAINGLSTINGSAYPPAPTPLTPDPSFSTITIGTGGNITFSDATGFLQTTAIYGRSGDELNLLASPNQGVYITGGSPPGTSQASASFKADGTLVFSDNIGGVPLTDATGLIIGAEGQTLTFPKNPAGTVGVGEIVNLSSINGTPYVPATAYNANPSFSTITTASAEGGTGFVQTSLLVSKDATDLNINSAIGNSLLLNGGALLGGINSKVELSTDGSISFNSVSGTIADGTGITISPEATTLTFPKDILSATGIGAIENLSSINGVAYLPTGSYPSVASFSTINMNQTGYIYAHNIEHPAGDAGDLIINQANDSGGLYIGVRDVGIVGIDQTGNCLINYNIDGGLQVNPAGNTLEFLQTSGSVVQGQIVGLSTINGVAYPPTASYPTNPTFDTVAINAGGNITFATPGGDMIGVVNLGVNSNITLGDRGTITLYGLTGNPGQVIGIPLDDTVPRWVDAGGGSYPADPSFSTITLASAGTISLEASVGSPGQYIGIASDGTTPAWLDLPAPVASGVSALNLLTGALEITSSDSFATITPSGTTIDITVGTGVGYGVASLNALTGVISLSSSDGTISITPGTTDIDLAVSSSYVPPAPTSISNGGGSVSVDADGVITATSSSGSTVVIDADGNITLTGSAGAVVQCASDGSILMNSTYSSTPSPPSLGFYMTSTGLYFNGTLVAGSA